MIWGYGMWYTRIITPVDKLDKKMFPVWIPVSSGWRAVSPVGGIWPESRW